MENRTLSTHAPLDDLPSVTKPPITCATSNTCIDIPTIPTRKYFDILEVEDTSDDEFTLTFALDATCSEETKDKQIYAPYSKADYCSYFANTDNPETFTYYTWIYFSHALPYSTHPFHDNKNT